MAARTSVAIAGRRELALEKILWNACWIPREYVRAGAHASIAEDVPRRAMKELIIGRLGALGHSENIWSLRALRAHEHETGHGEPESAWRLPIRLLEPNAPHLRLAAQRS